MISLGAVRAFGSSHLQGALDARVLRELWNPLQKCDCRDRLLHGILPVVVTLPKQQDDSAVWSCGCHRRPCTVAEETHPTARIAFGEEAIYSEAVYVYGGKKLFRAIVFTLRLLFDRVGGGFQRHG